MRIYFNEKRSALVGLIDVGYVNVFSSVVNDFRAVLSKEFETSVFPDERCARYIDIISVVGENKLSDSI